MRIDLTRSVGPHAEPLSPETIPGPAALQALSATERERLVSGLAAGLADSEDASQVGSHRRAILKVLELTDRVTFLQTLEAAAARGSLGVLVSGAGLDALLALGRNRGLNINDLLATTDSVSTRGLTTFEARRVQENFGFTVDPTTVRLRFTAGAQTVGSGALSLGNVINIDPTDPRWGLKPGTTLPRSQHDESWGGYNSVILGHELAHVWSYQHSGSGYAIASVRQQLDAIGTTGHRGGAYLYTPGKPRFLDYGEEQRAMLLQDYLAAAQAQRVGTRSSYSLYGGVLPTDEVLATLGPYVRELRTMGPGQAESGGASPPVACVARLPGFTQDGVAGALGAQSDALIAQAGRASKRALASGLQRGDLESVALGALGIGAAVGAAVVSREQNQHGARGGGSAILDQADIPRGVTVGNRHVTVGLKGGWDAPAPPPDAPVGVGGANPRGEVSLDVVAGSQVEVVAHADAALGPGGVREVGVSGRVTAGEVAAGAQARVWPETKDRPLRGVAEVDVRAPTLGGSAKGELTARHGTVETVDLSAQLESSRVSLQGEAGFAKEGDALAFKQGALGVGLRLTPELSVAARAALLPGGLDALELQGATKQGEVQVAVSAYGRNLTTAPSFGGVVAADAGGLGASVSAEATPSRGETYISVGAKIPLP